MNYQIINHDYMNTGGNCMVSVFEVWLKDTNRTVFVNIGEGCITVSSINHICRDIEIDDYREITLFECMYIDGDFVVDTEWYQLCRNCLYEYLKKDCKYFKFEQSLPYEWLQDNYKRIADNFKQCLTDDKCEDFKTDGESVWMITENGYRILLTEDMVQPMSLQKTIAASLFRVRELYDCNHEVMDDDDLGSLLITIKSLEHWFKQLN